MLTEFDHDWLKPSHNKFVEALRDNDLKTLGSCYIEAATLLAPSRPIIKGREAILSFWQNSQRIQDLAFETTTTQVICLNVLREAGNLIVTKRGQGRDTFNTAAKYIIIWSQEDRGWEIDCMAWSGAGSAKRGRRRALGRGGGRGKGRGNAAGAGRKQAGRKV